MADDVNIRLKTSGGRESAAEANRVSSAIGGIGRRARESEGHMRLFSRATVGATGGMRLAAGAALTGGAALGGALFIGIKRSTDAWQESRKVAAQTGAALRSTGADAWTTAGQIGALATSISRKGGVDDEAVQSGENLLLTFKKVRNEAGAGGRVFDRATAAAVDLSAAGFGSISSASIQLGKALNDPVKGLTALNRSGVTFTKGQQARIKHLVEEGNLLGAQKLLLREVESQVKGSAAAQATPLDRLKVSWQNVEEAIGKGVRPAVDAVAAKLDAFMVRAEPRIDRLGQSLGRIWRGGASTDIKIQMSKDEIRKQLGPLEDELQADIKRMKLGPAFSDAIDAAAPQILNAMGRNAGRGAEAFASGWLHADLGGKLASAALIGWKLGAFRSAGRAAGGEFYSGFAARSGPLIAAYISVKIGQAIANLPGAVASDLPAADLDPTVQHGRQMANDPTTQAAVRAFNRRHPTYAHRRATQGLTTRNLKTGIRLGDPSLIPGSPGVPSNYRPSVTATRGRQGEVVIHVHTHLDGKEVAKSTHRRAKDARASRQGG